ncbi:DUF4184 family protein [Actinoplanes sp. NPDC020271]|uniref:DUF4184 family protein n=1 Tax=Actinoplanes sp. NPDC020271 TaxID=3363896 RepID=UPI0037BC1E36
MPFTGSHPAAVLPFLGSAMPAAALVIGSMSPDLPLFVPMPYSVELSHELVGVATVDLAAGAALYLLWTVVLRPFLTDRIAPPLPDRPHRVVAGLGVGALTHVVWDSFTHADGWAVRHLPALQQHLGGLGVYEWAQYASGLFGLIVLTMWFRRRPPAARRIFSRPSACRVAGGLTVLGGVFGWWYGLRQPDPVRSAFFNSATMGIDAGAAGILVLAIARMVLVSRSRPDADAS